MASITGLTERLQRLKAAALAGGQRVARWWRGQDRQPAGPHTADPLARSGQKDFVPAGDALRFALDVNHPGAWRADFEIDHPAGADPGPQFLTWQFDAEELVSPFGPWSHSLPLKPGRHVYSAYLPFRAGRATGRLTLETTEGGWQVHGGGALGLRGGPHSVLRRVTFAPAGPEAVVPPNYLLLPITNFCNYKCVMCPHGIGEVHDRAHYPDPLADQVIAFLERATQSYRVALTGLGESLMSPVFYRVVDSVRNPLVRFHFCSNAAMLTQQRIDWILASPFAHLNVSLDAATAETYRKIRKADWARVIRNLEAFADSLARSGRTDLRLILNMTLMKENLPELEEFIRLTQRLRATAYVNQLHSYPEHQEWVVRDANWCFDYKEQILFADAATQDQFRRATALAHDLGVPFKVEEVMRPLLDEETNLVEAGPEGAAGAPIAQCPYPWVGDADGTAVVHADGNVAMCCLQGPIGRVGKDGDLAEIWNGPRAQEVRRDMLAGKIPKPCAGANCWFVSKQRALEGKAGRVPLRLIELPEQRAAG